MAEIYPGCHDNFQWLIRHLFMPQNQGKKKAKKAAQARSDPATLVLEWLLITVRAWDVTDLTDERNRLRAETEQAFPGLTHDIESVLLKLPMKNATTSDAIDTAREVVAVTQKYLHFLKLSASGQAYGQEANSNSSCQEQSEQGDIQKAIGSLQRLLSADEGDLPQDMGSKIQATISSIGNQGGARLGVAIPMGRTASALSGEDVQRARQVSTALRTRLQALMQSTRMVRNHSGYSGAIDTRRLHFLADGNARIFLRRGEKTGTNTAVHILLDVSGSMNGAAIKLAGQACYAVASALHSIKGVSVGVTAFPGGQAQDTNAGTSHWDTICQILKHGDRLHQNFDLTARGSTPMDTALWWTLQHLYSMPEPRKIILLITDGDPDRHEATAKAIAAIKSFGMEIYGIGIISPTITYLLPAESAKVIQDVGELSSAMFEMLQPLLLNENCIK